MQIRLYEELTMNALPATQTRYYDGWLLRFTSGHTARRCNAVYPLYPTTLDDEGKIDFCENSYQSTGKRTFFRMTDSNDVLERLLVQRGYSKDGMTYVQTRNMDGTFSVDTPGTVIIEETISDGWFEAYGELTGRGNEAVWQTFHLIQPRQCYCRIMVNDYPAVIGRGVLERGYLGLYDIVTHPDIRRQGYGNALVTAMLAWGQGQGAGQAYLQVEEANLPARSLYARLGFGTIYSYWYRVR